MDPISNPFTISVDQREKHPFLFDGLTTTKVVKKKSRQVPLIVPTQSVHLATGDYSIAGLEDKIAIERKSKLDLYGTLGQHRERFEDEHRRLSDFRVACVIVECSLVECLSEPPERSKLNPKTIFRTSVAWWIRYDVPWFFFDSRSLAESATFRILEKAFKEFAEC